MATRPCVAAKLNKWGFGVALVVRDHRTSIAGLGRFVLLRESCWRARAAPRIYDRFFRLCPAGQDYFKQSNTRLHYIATKILEMTVLILQEQRRASSPSYCPLCVPSTRSHELLLCQCWR